MYYQFKPLIYSVVQILLEKLFHVLYLTSVNRVYDDDDLKL